MTHKYRKFTTYDSRNISIYKPKTQRKFSSTSQRMHIQTCFSMGEMGDTRVSQLFAILKGLIESKMEEFFTIKQKGF